MTMLRNPGILRKRLTFVSKETFGKAQGSAGGGMASSRSGKSKNGASPKQQGDGFRMASPSGSNSQSRPFMSVIRRARINREKSAFAEYEVACSLRLSSGKVEKERLDV